MGIGDTSTSSENIAPFGAWKSPLTAPAVAAGAVRLEMPRLRGSDTYWVERRPAEQGRSVLVRRESGGEVGDLTPPPFSVRSRVHEFGGGAYLVAWKKVYFVNGEDQRVYRLQGGRPEAVTPPAAIRYADGVEDPKRERSVWVAEDHSRAGREPVNLLVSLTESGVQTLASGHDFYASPRVDPLGERIAWLSWNHPNMPWDGTSLWMGAFDDEGGLAATQRIAGGERESIFQPQWSPDGTLYFVSDRNGWWNLYRWRGETIESVLPMEADFGLPQWVFGMSTYGFASESEIVCVYVRDGLWRLGVIDPDRGRLETLETPYTQISDVQAGAGRAVFLGGSPTQPTAVVQIDVAARELEVLRESAEAPLPQPYISLPVPVSFPSAQGETAHGFFYRPTNPDVQAPPEERPPLIVFVHSGPTSAAETDFRGKIQYFTTRGFAVLDVNYGGSTGYGRAYRERLNGRWGIVDVADCAHGARWLAERGEVDGSRMAIRGSSAGGFTVLSALAFRDDFQAGTSYYGVSDLESMARSTHKFESHYHDQLVGPYPQAKTLFRERSPLHHVERIDRPVLLLQGLKDRVVPPEQAERMAAALVTRGVPVATVFFEEEGHSFRRAESIELGLETELAFYGWVFDLTPADPLDPPPFQTDRT